MNGNLAASSGKPLTLADFTSPALIVPSLVAWDMTGAIRELSDAFQKCDPRWDARKLDQAALAREQQMSTAMDFGAAFPHVRSNFCFRLQFALGRTDRPIVWGPRGSLSVRFVFLNAVPADDAMGYLKLVSGISRLAKDPAILEELHNAVGARALMEVLAKIPVRR